MRTLLAAGLLAAATAVLVVRGKPASTTPRSPSVVDSVIPREIAIARFRHGLERVDTLAGGERSRDALVARFVRALEAADTADLRRMSLTRSEYAWLYYETTPQGLPPYDLAPQLLWFLIEGRHAQGMAHLLESRAGRRGFAGYQCDTTVSREGANTVYGPCELRRIQAPGDTVSERLFGLIIERDQRFKFVSLANNL